MSILTLILGRTSVHWRCHDSSIPTDCPSAVSESSDAKLSHHLSARPMCNAAHLSQPVDSSEPHETLQPERQLVDQDRRDSRSLELLPSEPRLQSAENMWWEHGRLCPTSALRDPLP